MIAEHSNRFAQTVSAPEATAGVSAAGWLSAGRSPARELLRWLAAALTIGLVLAVATLWGRWLAGALDRPLDSAGVVLAGGLLVAVGAAARIAWRCDPACASAGLSDQAPHAARRAGCWRFANRPFDVVISLALLAGGGALGLVGGPIGAMALVWAALAAEEFWAYSSALRSTGTGVAEEGAHGREVWAGLAGAGHPTLDSPEFGAKPPAHVTQQFVRTRQPDGGEKVWGWVRVPVAPGQRIANVHVAFCPPLVRSPQLACAQQEGPPARIKEAQVFPYGARLDLKLLQPSPAATWVLVRIVACAEPPE